MRLYRTGMGTLDQGRSLEALTELDRRLGAKGIRAEVCLFGGAAMILVF